MRLYGVPQEPVALHKRGLAVAHAQQEHRTQLLEEEEAQGRVYMLCDDGLPPVLVAVAVHIPEYYPLQQDSVHASPSRVYSGMFSD